MVLCEFLILRNNNNSFWVTFMQSLFMFVWCYVVILLFLSVEIGYMRSVRLNFVFEFLRNIFFSSYKKLLFFVVLLVFMLFWKCVYFCFIKCLLVCLTYSVLRLHHFQIIASQHFHEWIKQMVITCGCKRWVCKGDSQDRSSAFKIFCVRL